MAEENKYAYNGVIRWSDEAVGKIGWDPENKTGEASVTDEVTGTVYPIGEGSGSESDFSVATVTFASQLQYWALTCYLPVVCEDNETLGTCTFSEWTIGTDDNPSPFQVVLYKGEAKAYIYTDEGVSISVSGNATFTDGLLTITGDCTINIDEEEQQS